MSTSVTITWKETVIRTATFDATNFYPGHWSLRSIILQREETPGTDVESHRSMEILKFSGKVP